MALILSTAPATEPLTLADVKLHLRVDITDDDTLIMSLLRAARLYVEQICRPRRALVAQTWLYVADDFPSGPLELRVVPLQSVTSVQYVTDAGVTATVSSADYHVDTYRQPGRIVLKSTANWPSVTLADVNGFRVTFVAGETVVPDQLKQALLLLIGHWYENRETVQLSGAVPQEIPFAVSALLTPYRGDRRGEV